jgi:hypothetical protein
LEGAQDLVTIEPAASYNGATTAKYNNDNDSNDEGGVVFLGFFGNGGHLVSHDFFSCLKK